MTLLQRPLRLGFMWLEGWMDRVFGTAWNPLYHLGALGFFYFWIVVVTGIVLILAIYTMAKVSAELYGVGFLAG